MNPRIAAGLVEMNASSHTGKLYEDYYLNRPHVEGLFDMLVTAQIIQDKKLQREVCAVYTNGAMVAGPMLKWFKEHAQQYDFVLIRDPDEAGRSWENHLKDALADGKPITLTPPDHLDPDEAFLSGWWPSGI